jgi:hypothetical protein
MDEEVGLGHGQVRSLIRVWRTNELRVTFLLMSKVVFPQLGGASLFIVWWWLPRDSYCSTCEWDGQPTINILVC